MINLARRHQDQIGQSSQYDVRQRIENSVCIAACFQRGRKRRRQAGVSLLRVEVGFTVEGRGEDRGARVIECGDRAFEAHAAEFLHALGFQAGEYVRFRGLQAIRATQCDVDDAQEFLFFDGGDSLPQ